MGVKHLLVHIDSGERSLERLTLAVKLGSSVRRAPHRTLRRERHARS